MTEQLLQLRHRPHDGPLSSVRKRRRDDGREPAGLLWGDERRDGSPVEPGAVSKRFGGLGAVEDASLEVRSGQDCAIIEVDRVGKTTLLNLICGVVKPPSGRLTVFGRDVIRWSPRRVAEPDLVTTSQKPDPSRCSMWWKA